MECSRTDRLKWRLAPTMLKLKHLSSISTCCFADINATVVKISTSSATWWPAISDTLTKKDISGASEGLNPERIEKDLDLHLRALKQR